MLSRKYKIENDKLVNIDGQPIPDDEPVFILRAQDRNAIDCIITYQSLCDGLDHCASVGHVIEDFRNFKLEHPERMKEPDTVEL